MKRLWMTLSVLLLVFGVVACGKKTPTPDPTPTAQERVDALHDTLAIGDLSALTNNSPRLILPTSRDGISISWSIDKLDYIAANGMISQPDHETGNQTVTLTATLTLDGVTRTKTFTATVLALPPAEEADFVMNETFESYNDGDILAQVGAWMPVSGKTGSSQFTVVSTIPGTTIPGGSKALQINAFTELQVEAALVHDLDLIIIEADLYQVPGGSPVYIQSSSSSPVVAFGLSGAGQTSSNIYYRTDNGPEQRHPIVLNQWYTVRFEVNLANKTVEFFFYEDGNLIPVTPGPVSFTGTTAMSGLFIRSGSSSNTQINTNSGYVTNIKANRIEAIPRPAEAIQLGTISGIESHVTVENGSTFSPSTPVVKNTFGSQRVLVDGVDYDLVVTHEVNTAVNQDYTVTYTFTNKGNATDVKVVTQTVTVYEAAAPNVIESVTSTPSHPATSLTTLTVNVLRPEGTLHYVVSADALDAAGILASPNKVSLTLASSQVTLSDVFVSSTDKVYLVVELNGTSNVIEHVVVPQDVTYVSTAEEFNLAVRNTNVTRYYMLANDIDFTGYTWLAASAGFQGTFDGQGYAIKNLTITNPALGYGGIFERANNAIITNLVLDNVHISTVQRAGILIGRAENNPVTVSNIVIQNSSVLGNDANGVGGLIGLVSIPTTISNISVVDTQVITTTAKNVGGVVGRVDSAKLTASDIFVSGVKVISGAPSGEDLGAGAFIGYTRDNAGSIVEATRIVVVNSEVHGLVGGALIGYHRNPATATITDAFVDVTFDEFNVTSGLIGRVNNESDKINTSSIFGRLHNATSGARTQELTNVVEVSNEAWWQANLASIYGSALWTFALDHAQLLNYTSINLPSYLITIDYNGLADNEGFLYREGQMFSYEPIAIPGYEFVGLFNDSSYENEVMYAFAVTAARTLYAKYSAVTTAVVSFDTTVEDLEIDDVIVNLGETTTAPVVPNTMIDGVLKSLVKWQFEGVDFDFTTTINENITLTAVWETVSMTVTFVGAENQSVLYGDLATEPTAPTLENFPDATFNGWLLNGELFDFNTPITANISLTQDWGIIAITTPEQLMLVSGSDTALSYRLANDLDFTGITWNQTGTASSPNYAPVFRGVLDGNGKTLSNITIVGAEASSFTGIFQRANGAHIFDLTIDTITVTNGRAGALIGRVENNLTTVEDVIIKNATINGSDANGVGILIGQASQAITLNRIVIQDSSATAATKNVGALIGRSDHVANITDLYIVNSSARSSANSTDAGIGGVIGYTNAATSAITLTRVVLEDVELIGRSSGALVGYYRYGSLVATDVFTQVTFTAIPGDGASHYGVVGRRNADSNTTDPVFTNYYASFVNLVVTAQTVQLNAEFMVLSSEITEAMWNTNLTAFEESVLWTFDATSQFYRLA